MLTGALGLAPDDTGMLIFFLKKTCSAGSPQPESELPKALAEVAKADGNVSIPLVFIQGSTFFPGKPRISQNKGPDPSR